MAISNKLEHIYKNGYFTPFKISICSEDETSTKLPVTV